MPRRRAKKSEPCPCESGKTYLECCFAKGFNWYADEQGRWVDNDGQPTRFDASVSATYPQNFVKHRVSRWEETEKHVISGLRAMVGQTLSAVDYVDVLTGSLSTHTNPSVHSFDWGHIQLQLGQLCVRFSEDYEPALWGDDILVCRQGTSEQSGEFASHNNARTTDTSKSEFWSKLIGEKIQAVRLYGDAEIPMAVSIVFDQAVVSIATGSVCEIRGDEDFDSFRIIRSPVDELFDSDVDLFWCNEDD